MYPFVILIALTGLYKEFIIIFSIILIHELGHFLMARLFNWNISSITIYPFGGCVKFNEKLNRPLYQELLILLNGPIFQILYFLLISIIYKNNLISLRDYQIFASYHKTLLIFNLLPIYPLDGGKLLNIVANYFLPYKKGNKIVIICSLLLSVCLIINIKNINLILMLILLICEIIIYYKNQDYLYNQFLLERYLNDYQFKRHKTIKDKNNMYKERKHIIFNNNTYQTEKDYLQERFSKK